MVSRAPLAAPWRLAGAFYTRTAVVNRSSKIKEPHRSRALAVSYRGGASPLSSGRRSQGLGLNVRWAQHTGKREGMAVTFSIIRLVTAKNLVPQGFSSGLLRKL